MTTPTFALRATAGKPANPRTAEVGHGSNEPTVVGIDGFRGRLITADHANYDSARAVWNGAIDRRPRLIARCIGTADVVTAVRFARDHNLEIAIRGGGHNVAGAAICDDGIVIDLSAMRAVQVDPTDRRAWVQGGALWGDVDRETQAHGLATTGEIVSHTGVAGLTLGGGIGWLMRKHGLTVDNLLASDVVTADGELLRASEDQHPDLFWALRGGGGNFGVATSFEFRLHSVGPTVLAGPILWDATDARGGPSLLPRLRPRRTQRARHGREIWRRAAATGHTRGSALAPGGDGRDLLRRADRGR